MASIITDITAVVTAGMGWLGQAVTTVTANPLLLLSVTIGFVGTGIGLMKRIVN